MMPLLSFVPFSRTGVGDALSRLSSRHADVRRDALDAIYRREAAAVYRYALAVCGNAAWAADATQEAFMGLAARPQGFDPALGTLGAYLAGAARHALAAQWRLLRREAPLPDDPDAEDEAAPGDAMPGLGVADPEAVLVRACRR